MLTVIPSNPAPEGVVPFEITTADRVRLRGLRCPPTGGGAARGTITLLHGRAEYLEKYFETIRALTGLGYAVVSIDWRGQGGSQRLLRNARKGHIGRIDHYERDLDALIAQILPDMPRPHVVLAHSTGGLVLFRALGRKALPFERAILSTPLFGLGTLYEPVDTAVALARALTTMGFGRAFVPTAGATPVDWQPFDTNPVTSDPRRFQRNAEIVEANPALALGGPTIGWVKAVADAMDEVMAAKFSDRVDTPCLIIAAGRDVLVSNPAIDTIGRRLRTGRTIRIDGSKHELMTERDIFREQFLAAVAAYLP